MLCCVYMWCIEFEIESVFVWFLDNCSYHDNAFVASRALHVVNNLNRSATFHLLESFFKYQVSVFSLLYKINFYLLYWSIWSIRLCEFGCWIWIRIFWIRCLCFYTCFYFIQARRWKLFSSIEFSFPFAFSVCLFLLKV